MNQLPAVGRIFFALAIIGLGAEHFLFDRFVVGRAPPLPEGGTAVAWAYLSGLIFVVCGAAILVARRGREAALLVAALVGVWALARHVPIVLTDSPFAPSWTDAGKALTFSGGALAVAALLPPLRSTVPGRIGGRLNATQGFIAIARVALGAFLFITGVQHFLYTEFVSSLVPEWIPGSSEGWAWFAGVALIAGGLGLQFRPTARAAALLSGCMVFSWFWLVHLPRTFDGYSAALAVFEALAVTGIAFTLTTTLHPDPIPGPRPARSPALTLTRGS